ncbi:MAG: RNA-binding transcriptional accessory protein [Lutibacter sp.]|uniref:Tex family protein n=1 Tax=Lutibacter sp. TaxID=1925666 RepID=UPI00182B63D7|nr:Tex family protein [Lutibacter sp.]MBT8317880.1 RNA-binding transcriptional accessory protein [Lutibacter sp.]NNJ58738.1 RNA-binding transcriptional accessory protein [Lutibacter sp.]
MNALQFIKASTNLSEKNIHQTVLLLNEDCTIPFIARYRKERTGNLDEVEIGEIVKYKSQFEELEKRKVTILKALDEQDVLSNDLRQKIKATTDFIALEDMYLPFKKKRKTKAETARLNGLEPLAKIIMSQKATDIYGIASKHLNKEVESIELALEGARFIMAEWINERMDIRNIIRYQLDKFAVITTKVIKKVENDEKAQKFKDFFDFSELLKRCPSHRLLALLRAEKEGFIRLKIEIDDEIALSKIESRIIRSSNDCALQIELAIKDAYKRILFPALSNEILNIAREKADDVAIEVFATNLKQLLLGAPLGEKAILAVDPGFRSGCKVVCLNAQGGLAYNETIYPHAPQNDRIGAIKKISSLVDAYKIEAIAIGNGTASRETEQLIRKIRFNKDIQVFVVSEAGASIYSASKIARGEFPNYDVTVRGAVSIGRRLADPLAELVKIDAKSIGVGQYQHDVDQHKLKHSLDMVVESCVNAVGVNINTASVSLLSYVSGISEKLAQNIIKYRKEQGAFTTRNQMLEVPRLGAKAFEQSAGFLRIKNGKNPLDDSAVHPESYPIVSAMANDYNLPISELIGNKQILQRIEFQNYTSINIGLPTLKGIISELEKPGLDPRETAKVFTFNQHIHTIADLREGQLLPGIVNNITNFGCFVDIGIKESGLVHISNLSDTFVSDVNAIVHLHQQVIVKVLEVDSTRKRIQLSLNF